MKTKKTIQIFFVAIFFVLTSCEKPIEKIGPDICPTNAFKFTTNDLIVNGLNGEGKIDFATTGVNIKAIFGETVKWTLKITSSTASKVYSGNTDSVNVRWFGNSDKLPLFDAGTVKISLEVACLSPFEKEYEILAKPTFKILDKTYGVLVRDWDKNGKYPVVKNSFDIGDGWQGVNGDGSQYFDYKNTNPSPVGGYYAEFYSKSSSVLWFFGGHTITTSDLKSHLSTTNADSLYLNFFVQGYGIANSSFDIGVKKDETIYLYTAPIDWTGWKFVSIKMSSLIVSSGPKSGNKLVSVQNVGHVLFQLGAFPLLTNEAKSGYDFLLITVGEPFFKN